ncbi:MAG: phosphohexomutase domain-containing protein [Planctomycetota bacterium]|jgi:phosphoglucosamine mutase
MSGSPAGTTARRWFGTDGIRTRAGEPPLVPAFLVRLGRALGEQAGPGGVVFLARDTRESGPAIVADLATGLIAAGADVLDLGVMPTAGLPVAMRARGAALGLMVSASHNPWQDNGIKVFGAGGTKLDDAREAKLEARVEALGGIGSEGGPAATPAQTTTQSSVQTAQAVESVGETAPRRPALRQADGAAAYREWILGRFAGLDLTHCALLVDCAHGCASAAAPPILGRLGARVTSIFDRPDGRNINAGCGSTHLASLAAQMASGRHDAGLAFDGDADRVLLVDRRGRTCDGDHMLAFLGPWLAKRGELPGRAVVATVMSNLGLQRTLTAAGVDLVRCAVGDRHVLAAMRAGGHALGGEASGHLLFLDEGHVIGDGLYTALRLLEGLRDTGSDVAALIDSVPRVPQILVNVPVRSRPPVEQLPRLTARVAALQAEHGDALRLVLRYSGTEDLARLMVEGLSAPLVESVGAELSALWAAEIEAQGNGSS